MRQHRFQYEYRISASKGHKKVGEILRTSPYFANHQSYQEWPVDKINPDWKSGREHFDWVVPSLKLVIEFHGQGHYTNIRFGGISIEESIKKFEEQKIRDEGKKQVALNAGWTYIAIPYNIKFDDKRLYQEYLKQFSSIKFAPPTKKKYIQDPIKIAANKKKASDYRKKQYQQMKEYRKKKDV
jgi:hypothetical protein